MSDYDFDSDDFDDDFDTDDFPATGPEGVADLDLETLAVLDGPSAAAFAARKATLTRVLVGGETGVQFASLALFAEPLFALYELDPADAFRLATEPESVADDTVALLETARVLWAFFSIPVSERSHERQSLAAQLVGEDPSEDDWLALDGLLEAANVYWQAMDADEVEAAEQTGHETLDFDALLHHPVFHVGKDTDDPAHAGPESLSDVEARAVFAQPLLEAAEIGSDPDAFEDALARADAYWAFARTAPADASEAGRAFARSTPGASAEEAEAMIRRYRSLFTERAG